MEDGRWASKRINEKRIKGAYTLLDSGAVLAFGTDSPVASLDSIIGICAAVTRTHRGRQKPERLRTSEGEVH